MNTVISRTKFKCSRIYVHIFLYRNETSNEVSTQFELGTTNILKSPIAIVAELGEGNQIIHKEIHVQLGLTNLLKTPLTLKLTIHRSDVFMFAGTNEVGLFKRVLYGFTKRLMNIHFFAKYI